MAAPPWPDPRTFPTPWTDDDDIKAANWLQHEGIMVGRDVAAQAIFTCARQHQYHPIRNYLLSLTWDLRPRIDTWLTTCLGVPASPYTTAVGRCFLISAVARVMDPGCQADHVLIFEGPQGLGKSSALKILAWPWFTDQLPRVGSKDAAMQLRGVWIIEVAEMDAFHGKEASAIKAFITSTTDRFRPPHARRVIESNRECVFAGSTNKSAFLEDETGGRRFWPVKCERANLDYLRSIRDQLWAEALAWYDADEPWHIVNPTILQMAQDEQRSRFEPDPWEERIAEFLTARSETSVADVLSICLLKDRGTWTKADSQRVGRTLTAMRWIRSRASGPGGSRPWVYRRPNG
jgi:predicted P-loop ATPase